MKKTRSVLTITLIIFGVFSVVHIYRVWQLNSQLEQFMAREIIEWQKTTRDDEWFKTRDFPIPTEYFVCRNEAYYVYENSFIDTIENTYESCWILNSDAHKKVSSEEWRARLDEYGDITLGWWYQIRPISGPKLCILITGLAPRSWSSGMGSIGVSSWSLDVSKDVWELVLLGDEPCKFRDTELLRTALFFVKY